MPLHPHTDLWRATIEGAPHLVCDFWLPAGCNDDQARMRAWEIWSHARAAGSNDRSRPVASPYLRIEKLTSTFVALAELSEAA